MDLKHEMRSFVTTGCILSLASAIPLVFAAGIGGALVSAVVGTTISVVVAIVRNNIAQRTRSALEGHAQIQGVLDSSQLEDNTPAIEETLPFGQHGKMVAVAVSLIATLATGGIVTALTHGSGINFNLGSPISSTKDTGSGTDKPVLPNMSEQAAQDVPEQYTAPEEDVANTLQTEPGQQDQAQQQEPTQEPAQAQTESSSAGTGQTEQTGQTQQTEQDGSTPEPSSTNAQQSGTAQTEQSAADQAPQAVEPSASNEQPATQEQQ